MRQHCGRSMCSPQRMSIIICMLHVCDSNHFTPLTALCVRGKVVHLLFTVCAHFEGCMAKGLIALSSICRTSVEIGEHSAMDAPTSLIVDQ